MRTTLLIQDEDKLEERRAGRHLTGAQIVEVRSIGSEIAAMLDRGEYLLDRGEYR